jgi:hypothetical protein
MKAVVAGTDEYGITAALEAEGVDVGRVTVANRPGLEEAGIQQADAYVLTDVAQATSISVAKDLVPELQVVVYADESLPDFARRQVDLVVDPDLLEPPTVAEELSA